MSSEISAQAFLRAAPRATIFVWDLVQALAARMDHRLKSTGLRSGLEGGQRCLAQKHEKFTQHHFCFARDVRVGAPVLHEAEWGIAEDLL